MFMTSILGLAGRGAVCSSLTTAGGASHVLPVPQWTHHVLVPVFPREASLLLCAQTTARHMPHLLSVALRVSQLSLPLPPGHEPG